MLTKLANDPKGKNWLLIKKKDEFQSTQDVTQNSRSVVSNEDIGEEMKKGSRAPMPHKIKPMLCYLIEKPFDSQEWIFENKWDGYRAIAEVTPKKVSLYSRNFISFNDKFPGIVKSLQRLKVDAVFDGEIVILDKKGHSQFQLLQNYLNADPVDTGILKYCVFDVLYYQGRDLRKLPLLERKEILKKIVKSIEPSCLLYSDHIEEKGEAFFEAVSAQGMEGIVAKEANSPYVSVRSRHWLKIKTHLRQEVVIAGFKQPQGSRKKFGALIIGTYKNDELVYAGHVGGGFNQRSLAEVHAQLLPLASKTCPFKTPPKTNRAATWVQPKLVCEVSFQEWAEGWYHETTYLSGHATRQTCQKSECRKTADRRDNPQRKKSC